MSEFELKLTPELEAAIKDAANPATIQSLMTAERDRQQSAAAAATTISPDAQKAADDKAAADKVAADAKAAADAAAAEAAKTPTTITRDVVIGGKTFIFEGATELEVERLVNVALQTANEFATRETPVDPAIAAKAAADKAAEDVAARTELDLKFKRGEISTTDYLEQSGAFAEYMAKNGVPLNELKAQVEQGRSTQFTNSWAAATEKFLNSEAGKDWPGGDPNKEILGLKLVELGLIDAEDKVAALAQAYAACRHILHPFVPSQTDAAAAAAKVAADKAATDAAAATAAGASASAAVSTAAAATSAAPGSVEFNTAVAAAVKATIEAMQAEANKKTPSRASSIFGASSGSTSNAAGAAEREVSKTVAIPADATPAEIMEAWKQQVAKEGKDPNAEFKAAFSTRRS